ncbi:MAG: retropepsin-like aspartic protease family protein [Sulfitobacter sp.]
MEDFDFARLIYLLLLGCFIGGYFIFQARENMNRTLQHAALWGFIFLGALVAVGLWQDVQRSVNRDSITRLGESSFAVPRAQDGHYYLTLEINGAPLRFVVDTGASEIVLTAQDARRAGLDPAALQYLGTAQTANGTVRIAPVTLDNVTLAGVEDSRVHALVNQGEMGTSLLGMGYLERWGRIEISRGELILTR